jgi:hypothetical protein
MTDGSLPGQAQVFRFWLAPGSPSGKAGNKFRGDNRAAKLPGENRSLVSQIEQT